jgi:hypothetical protein
MNQVIDTSAEMIAGYIAVALLYGGYVLSLLIRGRRVRERLAAIQRNEQRRTESSAPLKDLT